MATKKAKKSTKLARGKRLEEQKPLTVTRGDFGISKNVDIASPK